MYVAVCCMCVAGALQVRTCALMDEVSQMLSAALSQSQPTKAILPQEHSDPRSLAAFAQSGGETVLQVCCSVLQCVTGVLRYVAGCYRVLQCVAVCDRCVAVCCSVVQCVAVCCSVLQCVAVCCGMLQGVIEC